MRFPVLDGWRGICALLVCLFHLNVLGHFYSVEFIRGSYLFVDFFFVLSGFVITHAYSDRLGSLSEGWRFLVRRFGRVWPLHAVLLVAFVPLEILKSLATGGYASPETAAFVGRFAPSAIISNLALVHSLGAEDELTWNMPSWSISAEFFAYVTFALVCLTFRRARIITAIAVALAVTGALVVVRFSQHYIDTSFDYGYFRCLYGFFVGHVVYRLYARARAGGLTSLPFAGLVETVSLFSVIGVVSAAGDSALSFATPLLFGAVVWVFAFEGGPLSSLLATRPFQAIGSWSYSIYMVHALIIAMLQKGAAMMQNILAQPLFVEQVIDSQKSKLLYFGDLWVMDLLAVFYLLAVVVASSLTYRFVEMPGQALFNGFLSGKKKLPTAQPVAEVV